MSPVARPVAQMHESGTRWIEPDSRGVSATKDRRPSPPVNPARIRVSRQQLDEIQRGLSELDRSILLFVQQIRLATGGQLRRRFWGEPNSEPVARTARRVLQRLGDWRVLDPLPGRQIGGQRGGSQGRVWHVGPVGLRVLERSGFTGKRLATPGDRFVRHTLGICELIVRLAEADRTATLELVGWDAEPACWRPFVSATGGRRVLKPDLALRIGAGRVHEDRYLVEWDEATEGRSTLESKIRRHRAYRASGQEYAEHGTDPRVLWVVPDEHRAELLWQLLRGLPSSERELFAVEIRERVIGFLAEEARS